jgi:hypothetical protein
MPTLIVAARPRCCLTGGTLPATDLFDTALLLAASAAGWGTVTCDGEQLPPAVPEPAVYATTDRATRAATALDLALLEPPFDLLARVPERFLRRRVHFARFADLNRLTARAFVKPADPLDKWFDAGLYSDSRDIRTRNRECPLAPVLVSEPVEWSAEYRYFVLNGSVIASSPYLALGRAVWRSAKGEAAPGGRAVAERVCAALGAWCPPALVVDVGRIEDRGWAVVEFNPIWSAGLLAARADSVLPALRRATRTRAELTAEDARFDRRTWDAPNAQ